MAFGATGLTRLGLDELEELLRALHRGTLRFPLRHSDMIGSGLPHIVEKTDVLQGLDERALRVLLVCVIAERREQQRRERARERERERE